MGAVDWSSAGGSVRFRFSSCTSVGSVRAVNEDSVLERPPVFLVADGMGGHARGDRASAAAIEAFDIARVEHDVWSPADVVEALAAADRAVASVGDGLGSVAGTTLAGVVLVRLDDPVASGSPFRWMVLNVGDSRVYELHDGTLEQATIDHSVVQEMLSAGQLTPDAAAVHPDRNIITRALGVPDSATPDVLMLPADGEHVFLICSDGVSGTLGAQELTELLAEAGPEQAAAAVVQAAIERGSRDNVSAVIVEGIVLTAGDDFVAAPAEETAPRERTA